MTLLTRVPVRDRGRWGDACDLGREHARTHRTMVTVLGGGVTTRPVRLGVPAWGPRVRRHRREAEDSSAKVWWHRDLAPAHT
ncbi:hypothetical protein VV01_09525 [Luteipulveratus halotolerans]|uniref:Uncharacterized protein n=1 Tax=Luteipulveratus halotolerans TaxID=1631356 RepID=A0A0L6CHY5_9MICO|nr:hypothetical protein VV01_09525 [Luteipulveratus halotolerans]